MKYNFKKILAILLTLCMLFGITACGNKSSQADGEWQTEREYFYYDENGDWVEFTDESILEEIAAEELFEEEEIKNDAETDGDSSNDNSEKTENSTVSDTKSDSGKSENKFDDLDDENDKEVNLPAVDSSDFETLIDYCGNDGFDKIYEYKNVSIDTSHPDALEDDYRIHKQEQDGGDSYITYKVNGIAEFFVHYSYGGIHPETTNKIKFLLSKDNVNWTEIEPQDTVWDVFNGTSWTRCLAYFAVEDTKNKYLKILIDSSGELTPNPTINMVQINGLTAEVLGELGAVNSSLPAKNVYVDPENGKDTNSGTSEKEPLKSLYAVSKITFSPGSKILLKAGCKFSGNLTIKGNGTKDKPITLTSYGKGDKPVISARGGVAVSAVGEYTTITGIKITNPRGSNGIKFATSKPGAARGITITNCDFEEINTGFSYTGQGYGGIVLESYGFYPAWYDGVLIEGNTFKKVARNGIYVCSNWTNRDTTQEWGNRNRQLSGEQWYANKNVVIRNNTLDETGGDGIMLIGADGGLVEYNVISNSGLFKNAGPIHWVSAWCINSDNCVFQYNEVYGNSGKNNGNDLQAFDCDIACRNCVFQYNYSHDNEGGFMLICTTDETNNAVTSGTVVRYNLSVNDGKEGGHVFDITGSCFDSQIYNNTIYCGVYNLNLVDLSNYQGGPTTSKNSVFTNNIFYAKSGLKIGYGFNAYQSATFNNNVFYNIPAPSGKNITVKNVITSDPKLSSAGTTGTGLKKIAEKYKPKRGSIVLNSGIKISNNGGKDLLGKKINDKLIGALNR